MNCLSYTPFYDSYFPSSITYFLVVISAKTSFPAAKYLVSGSDKVLVVKKIGFCAPSSSLINTVLTKM